MLKVTSLRKVFKSGDTEVVAVDDASMSIEQGEFISIVGRSGSGKTTLMSLLGSLEKPTAGTIEVDGESVTKLRDHALNKYRNQKIGFVFQSYNLVPNLSALENVMLPMEPTHLSRAKRKLRAQLLLDQVGLEGTKQNRKPGRLSGGEQQRVAIARALANQPKVILADEPTGNLDSQTGTMIVDLLRDLARSEDTTIVVVTHDSSLAKQTDRIFRLQDGILKEEK